MQPRVRQTRDHTWLEYSSEARQVISLPFAGLRVLLNLSLFAPRCHFLAEVILFLSLGTSKTHLAASFLLLAQQMPKIKHSRRQDEFMLNRRAAAIFT